MVKTEDELEVMKNKIGDLMRIRNKYVKKRKQEKTKIEEMKIQEKRMRCDSTQESR